MTYIKKLVPQGHEYLLGLTDINVIQRSGYFIKGQTSYKYNFAPEYFSRYLSFPLNNAKLILRIEKAQEGLRKEAAKSIWGNSGQIKYLKQLTLSDDYNEFIESAYTAGTDQYNYAKASATRILNGDIFYSIDSTEGRFHSNLTNMPSGLRAYLRINNEPLVSIDVRNSLPYLSTIILTYPGKASWLAEDPAFACLLQNLKVSMSKDVKKYIYLVTSGQLYEYLMAEFAKEGLILTRDDTKKQVLRILAARNWMPKDVINRKARQIFIRNFPTVHRIFSKVRGHEKGNKFQGYERFSILLARIESYLILHVVLKRIQKELPGTIAMTIHDSVMTGILTNNVEIVREIVIDELTNFIGFAPQIKTEHNTTKKNTDTDTETPTLYQYHSTDSVCFKQSMN